MLSKNNHELLAKKMESKKQRFAIKRLTVGVASVLVGTTFMVQGGEKVHADEAVQQENSAVQIDASSESSNEVVLKNEAPTSTTEASLSQENAEVVVSDKEDEAITENQETNSKLENKEADDTLENKEVTLQNDIPNESMDVDVAKENTSQDAVSSVTPVSKASNSNSSFRTVQDSNEMQIYTTSSPINYGHNGDNKTAKITFLAGYIQKDQHTSQTETIRWVIKYKPTVVLGKATSAPVGIRITANNAYTLPDFLLFNGQRMPRDPMSGNSGEALYYSSAVKAKINAENTIELTTIVKGRSPKTTGISFDFGTSNNPNDTKKIDPLEHTYAQARNLMIVTAKMDEKKYEAFLKEVEAPEDKIETSEIPFTVEYQADPNLEVGKTVIVQEGVNGEQTKTTKYTIQNGNVIENVSDPVVTKDPITEIINVGTKSKIEKTEIAFDTIYRGDESRPAKAESIANTGVKGEITTTTTYTLDPRTGNVTANEPTSVTTREKIDRVIVIGTKPTITETEIPFETSVQLDETMNASDPEVIVTVGKVGKKIVTTTYAVDAKGKITENTVEETVQPVTQVVKKGVGKESDISYQVIYQADKTKTAGEKTISVKGKTGVRHPNGTVMTPAVDEVVLVGTKPSVVEEVLAYQTRYEEDAMMKADEAPIVLVVGKNGKKVTTTTYKLDTTTGKVTENTPQVEVTEPVDEVIKKGVGKESDISYQVIYQADKTKTAGEKTISVKGKTGVRHPNGTVMTPAVDEVVLVGTKPSVVEEVLAYQTRYEEDAMMKADEAPIVLVVGKNGKKVTTTTYKLDTTTGKVTENTPQVEVTEPVDEVIKKGVGKESDISYQVIYQADKTKTAGEKTISVKGKTGVRHPNGTVMTPAVDEVVLVGTKPSVVEEVLAYQTRYEEDAMMKADEAPIVLVVGKNGKKVTTTTYKLDTTTGKVTENTPQVEVTEPVDEVIKKGVGKESDISYQVIYRADETRPLGVKTVSVKGQNGIMHPNGTITKAPVTEVVLVGIKPNVAEVAVPYHVVLIEDSTMLKTDPKIEIVAGKDGKAITTTSYALNETTGLVTVANVAKELIPAIDQEVKVGIGENKEIMYETRYVADEELEAGVTEVRVTGQVGVRHPNGTITTEPVTEIIAVGTMPKISEEILGFETIYQEDPNLPLGEMCVITPGKEGIKRLITTYTVDEVTGELIEMTSEEITEPQAEIVAKGTKVTQKEVVKTPEVKSVVAQTKEQPVPKSQELPQMGDKNKADTAMLLGSLGVLSALGLVAFSKKRKEER